MTTDDTTPTTGSTRSIEARLARAGLPPLPRQAWLEVDLDVLAANAHLLRSLLPNETLLGLVVKADGYGHGLEAAARAAVAGGADVLLVATLDEALILRAAGRAERILVLYPVPEDAIGTAADAGVEVVAADEASVEALEGWLRDGGATTRRSGPAGRGGSDPSPASPTLRVHLGIDSGMGRGGFPVDAAPSVARRLLEAGLPGLAGTWSHLASPEDPAPTAAQVARFEAALAGLAAAGVGPGLRHL
ncbi:MAG TPA: alanine racemase, partial [Candidatus Limnocylindrales bacterium]|nr:alanine racemase [Candidatus Limnocylindrales bacterium]